MTTAAHSVYQLKIRPGTRDTVLGRGSIVLGVEERVIGDPTRRKAGWIYHHEGLDGVDTDRQLENALYKLRRAAPTALDLTDPAVANLWVSDVLGPGWVVERVEKFIP